MKKILTSIILVSIVLLLAACGKNEDMSGNYFFKRAIMGSDDVGRLTLWVASDDNTKYNASESSSNYPEASEGELTLNDKSFLDITLSPSSYEINRDDTGYDISNMTGIPYEYKKGVLSLGDDELIFYRDDTEEGKELQELWLNGATDETDFNEEEDFLFGD